MYSPYVLMSFLWTTSGYKYIFLDCAIYKLIYLVDPMYWRTVTAMSFGHWDMDLLPVNHWYLEAHLLNSSNYKQRINSLKNANQFIRCWQILYIAEKSYYYMHLDIFYSFFSLQYLLS